MTDEKINEIIEKVSLVRSGEMHDDVEYYIKEYNSGCYPSCELILNEL